MFEELERIINNPDVSCGTKIAMLKAKFDIKPKNPLEGCVERFDIVAHADLIVDFDKVDLFEHPESLSLEVQHIIYKFSNNGNNDYVDCAELVKELNSVGYTCDYYLDAEPYNLRKI